jgi:pyruvate dehydrogenase E2 component (dihydrolipoamide acetyltransferase)
MTQGNIAKWYVKPGDEIAPGTVLADIETDKATLAFENQEDGFIAAITMPEGSKDVPVGATVAIVVEEAGDVAAFANRSSSEASSSSAPAQSQAAAAAPTIPSEPVGSFPDHVVSRQ